MDFAFLVKGRTGCYPGEAVDWVVAVYLTRDKAEAHVRRANEQAIDFLKVRYAEGYEGRHLAEPATFDPFFQSYDSDTTYAVEAVPLMETSNEANMTLWPLLKENGEKTAQEPVSEVEQDRARQDFLASLPRAKSKKAHQPARADRSN